MNNSDKLLYSAYGIFAFGIFWNLTGMVANLMYYLGISVFPSKIPLMIVMAISFLIFLVISYYIYRKTLENLTQKNFPGIILLFLLFTGLRVFLEFYFAKLELNVKGPDRSYRLEIYSLTIIFSKITDFLFLALMLVHLYFFSRKDLID